MSGDLPIAPSIFGSFDTTAPSTGSEKSGGNRQGGRGGQSGKFRGNENLRGKSDGKLVDITDNSKNNNIVDASASDSTVNPPSNARGKGARRGPPPTSITEGRNNPPPKNSNRNNKKPADVPETAATFAGKPNIVTSTDTADIAGKKNEKKDRGKNSRKGGGKNANVNINEENKDNSASSFKEIVAPPLPPKKTYKLIVRKLPPSRDYTKETFQQHLSLVLTAMQITSPELLAEVHVDHFIEGKISRKRGPVNGAGVVVFTDEHLYQRFLAECPSSIPFLPDESFGQPEVTPAIFIKAFRQKEKPDVKYMNTFMEDKEFLAFQEQMNKPKSVQKAEAIAATAAVSTAAPAAASSSSSSTAATGTSILTITQKMQQLLQNNALLQFLREKSNRAISRRRKKAVAGLFASSASVGGSGSGKLTRKEKEKMKLLKKKEMLQQRPTHDSTGIVEGKKQSVAAKEIAKILNVAKAEGRTTFTRAEKDALAKWRKKEKKHAKKEEKILAEAMEMMRLHDGDGKKTLEDFVKEVKRNYKKNRGSEKMADGSTSVSTSLKSDRNVVSESKTNNEKKNSDRRGSGRGSGRGRRDKDSIRDDHNNIMVDTAPSVMRVLKRDATL